MNHPTDPMTPVRALIEAAQAFDDDRKRLGGVGLNQSAATAQAAFAAIPSISQLLSEHDKVVEYIKELLKLFPPRAEYVSAAMTDEEREQSDGIARILEAQKRICADRLAAIVEGK